MRMKKRLASLFCAAGLMGSAFAAETEIIIGVNGASDSSVTTSIGGVNVPVTVVPDVTYESLLGITLPGTGLTTQVDVTGGLDVEVSGTVAGKSFTGVFTLTSTGNQVTMNEFGQLGPNASPYINGGNKGPWAFTFKEMKTGSDASVFFSGFTSIAGSTTNGTGRCWINNPAGEATFPKQQFTVRDISGLNTGSTVSMSYRDKSFTILQLGMTFSDTKVEITGYDSLADVNGGTKSSPTYADEDAVEAALLSIYPTVTITGGSDTRGVTAWTGDGSYTDGSTAGTYTFTATLADASTLPAKYKDDTPETVTVDVVVGTGTVFDFEDDTLQNWIVLSGSTFTDPVTTSGAYGANISGSYCLNTLYATGGSVNGENATGIIESPVITVTSDLAESTDATFYQGGSARTGTIFAVYLAADDTLIQSSQGVNNTTGVQRTFDLSGYRGQNVYFRLVDSVGAVSGGWRFALVDNIVAPGTVDVAATTARRTVAVEITGYEDLEDVPVRAGGAAVDTLSKVQALLPTTVTIDGTSDTRTVTWTADSSPSYDYTTPGTYVFTATLGAYDTAKYKDDTPETVTVDVVVTNSFAVEVVDGASSSITSSANLSGDEMSFMAWINLSSSSARGCLFQIAQDGNAGSSGMSVYLTGSTGRVEFWEGSNGGTNYRDLTKNGGTTFPTDQWVHLAVTSSLTNTNKIYINGVAADTTRTRISSITNAILSLGRTTEATDPITKAVYDEVVVLSSELTAQQISNIYDSGKGHELSSSFANMELYWRFEDEPQAKAVADSDDAADSSGTVSGTAGTDFKWVQGVNVGTVVTPAIELKLALTDDLLEWAVGTERDVKEYRVLVDGELFDTVKAVGADNYSLKVPAGNVILIVVDNSGHSKSFTPADGNVVTEIYSLKAGWNLIAVTSDNADLDKLSRETAGVIWGWNGAAYGVIDSANATDAVWVYTAEAKTVHVIGEKSDAVMTLNSGWNMVGPIVTADVPKEAEAVYAWDAVYTAITEKYSTLEQGKGYWIFAL